MECRKLLRKVSVEYETWEGLGRKELNLEYYLLESDYCESKELNRAYGFEIRKIQNGQLKEMVTEYGIGGTHARAKEFIEVLAENAVTPVEVPYILDDMARKC